MKNVSFTVLQKYSCNFQKFGFVFVFFLFSKISLAQSESDSTKGHFSGSLQVDYQKYLADNFSPQPIDNHGLNTYLTLQYRIKNLQIGGRYEGYFPHLLGYSDNLRGQGLANRFISYKIKKIDLTAGNFYEQFGNGMILRAYENRFLGIDNSLDGFRTKYNAKGYRATAFLAKQRVGFLHSDGTLIGFDNELIINELIHKNLNYNLTLGASFVQKNESYDGILKTINPIVNTYSSRVNFQKSNFSFAAEYASKSSDTSPINHYSTHTGNALLLTSNFDINKSSISLIIKRIDNMDFRSQRTESLNSALINYIPAATKQHTYRLLNLYPYATQVLGEIAAQIDLVRGFSDGSTLSCNVAMVNGLNKILNSSTDGYSTNFFEIGKEKYYRDFNAEYEKKWSKKFKTNILLAMIDFNKGVVLGSKPELVHSFTAVLDGTYKFTKKQALRIELQHLSTKQDLGNWTMILAEYSISPHYFFYASDEVNYGDSSFQNVRHYYNFGTSINILNSRLSISYGRNRVGLLCVGGVCRLIPAYTGLSLNLIKSF